MKFSFARDAAFNFVYDNTLIRLYALSHKISFFSILDNECPEADSDVVVLSGGYPELYANELKKATRISVFLRRTKAVVYAECGGYMLLSKLVFSETDCWFALGVLDVVVCASNCTLAQFKYCVLLGDKRGVFAGHEFHYYNELSRAHIDQSYVYLVKLRNGLKLEGANVNNMFGSFVHCIGSIR
ncbi:MAG: hypothetical protein AAI978_00395 [Candidatus Hodgkinia cicadicola]